MVFVLADAQVLEIPTLTPALKVDVSAVENDVKLALSVDEILLTPSTHITAFPSNLPVVQSTKFNYFLNSASVNAKPIDDILEISSSVFNELYVSPSKVLVEKNAEIKSSVSIVLSSSKPIQDVQSSKPIQDVQSSTPIQDFQSSTPIQDVQSSTPIQGVMVGKITPSVSRPTPSASNKEIAPTILPTTKPVVTILPKIDTLFNQSCVEKGNICIFKPACGNFIYNLYLLDSF